MRIELGDKARDTITGFTGICTARTDYVSGCTRVTLQPQVGGDGKLPEAGHFDEPACEVVDRGFVKAMPTDRGGPRPPTPQHPAPTR